MLSLEELKKDADLINEINWDLGPEEAVKLYLEWGNTDWGSGKYTIRSKDDYSTYFVAENQVLWARSKTIGYAICLRYLWFQVSGVSKNQPEFCTLLGLRLNVTSRGRKPNS